MSEPAETSPVAGGEIVFRTSERTHLYVDDTYSVSVTSSQPELVDEASLDPNVHTRLIETAITDTERTRSQRREEDLLLMGTIIGGTAVVGAAGVGAAVLAQNDILKAGSSATALLFGVVSVGSVKLFQLARRNESPNTLPLTQRLDRLRGLLGHSDSESGPLESEEVQS